MNRFSDLITTEDQYEVAKAKAEIAVMTSIHIDLLDNLLSGYFPWLGHSRRVAA